MMTKKVKPEDFRKKRLALELTQEQCGEELGVTRRTVVRWENEEIPIPQMAMMALDLLASKHK